ncbi:MAG: GerAB/ArcD/ProY family transporter [Christensenellaceae bacterium]
MVIKNNIKVRQIMMVFIALMPVSKLLILPPVLARYAENQLYMSMILNFSLDILTLFVILKINDLFPDKTFFAILQDNFGQVTARIIFFVYGIFFFMKCFIPILEQKYFVDNTLYEVFPNIISFFPVLALTFYASIKGLKTMGRCADIAVFFTVAVFLLTVFLSFSSCDFTNVLPVKLPEFGVLKGSFATATWYFDSLYMLLFLGHFDKDKNKNRKIILSYSGASIAVIIIALLFLGNFGPIASIMNFAISDMTIFTSKLINVGRFDYLTIFLLLASSVFAICLPVFVSTKCFVRAFGLKTSLIPAIVVNALLFISLLIFEEKFYSAMAFVSKYINVFFIATGYVLPIVLYFILRCRRHAKV